jgi:hypothetical protein
MQARNRHLAVSVPNPTARSAGIRGLGIRALA